MNAATQTSANTPPASKKYHALIMLWILAWVGSTVAIKSAIVREWFPSDAILVLFIGLNVALGLGTIITFMRMLTELDELQKKIQLDALAMAMGIGLVGGFGYVLMVAAGLVESEDVSALIMLMGTTYSLGIVVGRMRYR